MSERKVLGVNNYVSNRWIDSKEECMRNKNEFIRVSKDDFEEYKTVKKGLDSQFYGIERDGNKQNVSVSVGQKSSQETKTQCRNMNKKGDTHPMQLVNKVNESQELISLREYYKNCLRSKKQLQRRCQQLETQNRLLSIKQKSIQQLKSQTILLTSQLNHYKSQLFNTKDKLKRKDQQYMDKVLTSNKQLQINFQINQETNNIKINRLQKELQNVQHENYQLRQEIITLKNHLKRINLENQQLSSKINQITLSIDFQEQQILQLKKQYDTKLKRTLQSISQKYQLKLINLQSQLQMQKFKYQTVNQEYKSLSSKLQQSSQKFTKIKQENHQYLQINDELSKKCLDFSFLLKQVISKIQQLSSEQASTLVDYVLIVKEKVIRIEEGKNVTYLQSNTKNFIPINWRSQQHTIQFQPNIDNCSSENMFTKLNCDLQCKKQSNQNNQTKIIKTSQKEKRFTFNPYQDDQQQHIDLHFHQQKVQSAKKVFKQDFQFENKILKQRNAIEARIRSKYQSQKKQFDQLIPTKQNQTHFKQQPKSHNNLICYENQDKIKDKIKSKYLTRQFSFEIDK